MKSMSPWAAARAAKFSVAALALSLSGCLSAGSSGGAGNDDGASSSEEECEAGDEGCECYPNDTCNDDLACRSNLCVDLDSRNDDDGDGGSRADDEQAQANEPDAADDDGDDRQADEESPNEADPDEPAEADQPAALDEPAEADPDDGPEADEAVTDEPPDPSADEPSADEPATDEPSADEPATDEPATDEPATDDPAPPAGGGGSGGIGAGGAPPVETGAGGSGGTPVVEPPSAVGNLITNGDFSAGDLDWDINDGADPTLNYDVASGAMCVTLGIDESFIAIGWPLDPLQALILDGAQYELSYQAWASSSDLEFTAKVGEAELPYDEHFEEVVLLSASVRNYSHGFTPVVDTPSGIVFLAQATFLNDIIEVCVDNVVLREIVP
jgi:hypothetical protein